MVGKSRECEYERDRMIKQGICGEQKSVSCWIYFIHLLRVDLRSSIWSSIKAYFGNTKVVIVYEVFWTRWRMSNIPIDPVPANRWGDAEVVILEIVILVFWVVLLFIYYAVTNFGFLSRVLYLRHVKHGHGQETQMQHNTDTRKCQTLKKLGYKTREQQHEYGRIYSCDTHTHSLSYNH